jgi:hypothetical protein
VDKGGKTLCQNADARAFAVDAWDELKQAGLQDTGLPLSLTFWDLVGAQQCFAPMASNTGSHRHTQQEWHRTFAATDLISSQQSRIVAAKTAPTSGIGAL